MSFVQNRYRLIILRKSLLFILLSKYLRAFSTHQYCFVEFSFKFFDKIVKKRNFLKNINLYCPSFCSYSKVLVWYPLFILDVLKIRFEVCNILFTIVTFIGPNTLKLSMQYLSSRSSFLWFVNDFVQLNKIFIDFIL